MFYYLEEMIRITNRERKRGEIYICGNHVSMVIETKTDALGETSICIANRPIAYKVVSYVAGDTIKPI